MSPGSHWRSGEPWLPIGRQTAGVMMSRYFLHLCERTGSVVDGEGIDADHEEDAVHQAVSTIRDVIANDILAGTPVGLDSYILIQDARGHELRRIYFRDAVHFVEEPLVEPSPRKPD